MCCSGQQTLVTADDTTSTRLVLYQLDNSIELQVDINDRSEVIVDGDEEECEDDFIHNDDKETELPFKDTY